FLAHQLELLREAGVGRVVLCVGHMGQLVRDEMGDGSQLGVRIDYSDDGPVFLGTAGALKRALPLLGTSFFVLSGDSYLEIDYRAVYRAFSASGKLGLMTIYRNEGRWDRSNVHFERGVLMAYDKRNPSPPMQHIDYGLGLLKREALDGLPDGEP